MAEPGSPTRNLRLTTPQRVEAPSDDQLSIELDAIITIGRVLSNISDLETRNRVMRWAIERFGIDVPAAAEEPAGDLDVPHNVVPPRAEPDLPEALTVDGLTEMFGTAPEETAPAEQTYSLPARSLDRRAPKTSGDRLRDALHWMGL